MLRPETLLHNVQISSEKPARSPGSDWIRIRIRILSDSQSSRGSKMVKTFLLECPEAEL
jgi:hypothetical protein